MQHEDHDAYNVVQVANAVLAAKRGDPLRSACGLALFASVLAEDDEVARTTVALVMLQLALELDPDLFFALRWH
jgi:hypothetical protein